MASLEDTSHKHKPNSRRNSRPTTPLRRSSRGSFSGAKGGSDDAFPLNALEPAFAELSDAMGTLEANFGDLQTLHNSLSRFNENFSSFLYGLNMNAFCMDFPEAPLEESFKRAAEREASSGPAYGGGGTTPWKTDYDTETTFMTNDTSFVTHPEPDTDRAPSPTHFQAPARRNVASEGTGKRGGRGRGGSGIARGRGLRHRK